MYGHDQGRSPIDKLDEPKRVGDLLPGQLLITRTRSTACSIRFPS